MILYVLALAGLIIHLVLKWRDAWTQKQSFDFKKHIIYSLINYLVVCVLIAFKESFKEWIAITPVVSFFLGYFADSVVKNLEAYGRKRIKMT